MFGIVDNGCILAVSNNNKNITDMNFDSQITQYLMDGGQIVSRHHHKQTNIITILIRMPKGKFIPDTRIGQYGNEFEYVVGQNDVDILDGSSIFPILHMNHHPRTAKKKAMAKHNWEVYYKKRRPELSAS